MHGSCQKSVTISWYVEAVNCLRDHQYALNGCGPSPERCYKPLLYFQNSSSTQASSSAMCTAFVRSSSNYKRSDSSANAGDHVCLMPPIGEAILLLRAASRPARRACLIPLPISNHALHEADIVVFRNLPVHLQVRSLVLWHA